MTEAPVAAVATWNVPYSPRKPARNQSRRLDRQPDQPGTVLPGRRLASEHRAANSEPRLTGVPAEHPARPAQFQSRPGSVVGSPGGVAPSASGASSLNRRPAELASQMASRRLTLRMIWVARCSSKHVETPEFPAVSDPLHHRADQVVAERSQRPAGRVRRRRNQAALTSPGPGPPPGASPVRPSRVRSSPCRHPPRIPDQVADKRLQASPAEALGLSRTASADSERGSSRCLPTVAWPRSGPPSRPSASPC